MSIFEIRGGPVTYQHLIRKKKEDLVHEIFRLIDHAEFLKKELEKERKKNEQ